MFKCSGVLLACIMQISLIQNNAAQEQSHNEIYQRTQSIFNSKCITCHNAEDLAAGMSLETGLSYRNLVNVTSHGAPDLKRIEPNNPEGSYLYRKVVRDPVHLPFKEDGMPLDGDKLSDEEIGVIRNWIRSFPTEIWGESRTLSTQFLSSSDETTNDFLATQLIALPTTNVLGSRTAEFRILHRFASINGGGYHTLGSFFGLDNGAITSINVSLGINRNTDVLIRRSGENKDVELAVKHILIKQSDRIPVSLGMYAGLNWISRSDVNAANRVSPIIQVLTSSRINDKLSVLVTPTIVFRSNHQQKIIKEINDSTFFRYRDTRATFAIGLGAQYCLLKNTALTGEFIPRISGYRGNRFAGDPRYHSWSLGLAYKVRLHVFQILVSNNQSIHTSQYVPGSTDKAVPVGKWFNKGPSLHFGFNIYRQFKW